MWNFFQNDLCPLLNIKKVVYHLLHFLCRIKSIIRGRSGQNSAIASQVFIAAIINWFWVVSKVWGPKPSTTIQLETKNVFGKFKTWFTIFITTLFQKSIFCPLKNCQKCRIKVFHFPPILAFTINFCPFKSDLSGSIVWQQASGFLKLAKMDHFWHL